MKNTTSNGLFSDKFVITNMPTWQFVLLAIGTLGMWHSFWLYTFSESINKYEKRTIIHLTIPIVAIVVWASAEFFSIALTNKEKTENFLYLFFTLVAIILELCIYFMSKPVLEKMLAENGTPRRLNGFLCFLIPGYYQYYIIRKAEEHFANEELIRVATTSQTGQHEDKEIDKLAQIEKLAALKNSGAISDEEFSIEKKKILSEEN